MSRDFSPDTHVLGPDVYGGNGPVDWRAVAAAGHRFAFVKASEGAKFTDKQFRDNWRGIGALPPAPDGYPALLRGAYHFARPGQDAAAQAAHFRDVVGELGVGDLPPVVDLERGDGLGSADALAWVLEFVAAVESAFSRRVVVYTGHWWRSSEGLGDPVVPQLADRPLWAARYGSSEPVVPRTWPRWDFWQFTDGKAGQVMPVPGVSGHVDVSAYRGDFRELLALAGYPPA